MHVKKEKRKKGVRALLQIEGLASLRQDGCCIVREEQIDDGSEGATRVYDGGDHAILKTIR